MLTKLWMIVHGVLVQIHSWSNPTNDALQAWAEESKASMEASLLKAEKYRAEVTRSVDFSVAKCMDTLNEMENVSNYTYFKVLENFLCADWRGCFSVCLRIGERHGQKGSSNLFGLTLFYFLGSVVGQFAILSCWITIMTL